MSVNVSKKGNQPLDTQKRRKRTRKPRAVVKYANAPKQSSDFSPMDVSFRKQKLQAGVMFENAYVNKIVNQIVAPEKIQGRFSVSPNSQPYDVAVRHFRRVSDYAQATYPTLSIFMNPDLFMPSYATSSINALFPSAGLGPVDMKGTWEYLASGELKQSPTRICTVDQDAMTQCVDIPDAAAVVHKGLNVTANAAAQNFTLDFKNTTKKSGVSFTTHVAYKVAAGNWTDIVTFSSTEGDDVNKTVTLPALANAVCVYMTASSYPVTADIVLDFVATQVITTAAHLLTPGFEEQAIDYEITVCRVIGMACLITNTSSSLNDGGNIQGGKVPRDFNPFATSVVEDLSKLGQHRTYAGMLKTGMYMWWMPSQLDEQELDNISKMRDTYRAADKLYAKITDWTAGASVRVTYHWVVEFYSPKQIFEKEPTPMVTDAYRAAIYSLGRIPAAMCNPSHLDDIKAWIRSATEKAKEGMAFYEKHAGTINAGILALAELAA